MRRLIAVLIIVAMLLPNFAFAAEGDIGIGIDNKNNISATGGYSEAEQEQDQKQKQKQEQILNSFDRRNHIMALPGPSGNFPVIPPIVDTEVFKPYFGVVYSVEELGYIVGSASYGDRPGLLSYFTSPVTRTLHMKKFEGQIDINATVELVNMSECKLVKTLGVYHGTGAYGYPMEAILAYTLRQAKMETNASFYAVEYKSRKNPSVSGFAIGSGGAASVLSGGNDRGAGSVSVGAVIGKSTAYLDCAYDVIVRAVVVDKIVVAKEEKTLACNPSEYYARLKTYIQEIVWCVFRCLNNAKLRFGKGTNFLDIYYCEGRTNKEYLRHAIYEFGVGERDIVFGRELAPGQKPDAKPKGRQTKTLHEGQVTLQKIYYNWSWAVRELDGEAAQIEFMKSKGIKSGPDKYEELKR